MTEKLYYNDATVLEFTAEVVAQNNTPRGPAVSLDRTAFYPTSGGQPHDTGTLDDIPVLDVWKDEEGGVWHLLASALEGNSVVGRVDKARRFDHTQQHTGQHLLSAGFYNLHHANTVGFHLGAEVSTIDLDIPDLSWEAVFAVEQAVNAVIWENRPVTVDYVTSDALGQIPLRKPPQVEGVVRVIWVQGYDTSACGGTHVRNTGEIGIIKITGIERYKGGMRVSFLCGERALLDYQQSLHALRKAGEELSVARLEVPGAVQRLQTELGEMRRNYTRAQSALLDIEADHLWEQTPEGGGVRCVVAQWREGTFDDARRIANRLRGRERTVILLATLDEKGIRLVCARSEDLPSLSARHILDAVLVKMDGRGGGSPRIAQGGAGLASPEEISKILDEACQSIALD